MESKAEARRQNKIEYLRLYRIEKAEELSEKGKEKRQCDCGLWIRKCHLPEHKRRSLHAKELQKRQQILEEKTSPDIVKLILSFL